MAEDPKIYNIGGSSELSELQDYSSYTPKQIGTYSISEGGDFIKCNTARIPKLRNFEPFKPLDLNEGYDPKEDYSKEKNFQQWEKVLKWIQESGSGNVSFSEVDVVSQRGVLKDIGYTYHDRNNKYKNLWKFEACKFMGKVYIRKVVEEEGGEGEIEEKRNRSCYQGRRFEKYLAEQEEGVHATYKMLKGTIGDKTILISAEIDAVTADEEHVEIKTCLKKKQLYYKVPMAWLQSYLGKVDILYYGLRGEEGIVKNNPTKIPVSTVAGSPKYKEFDANAMIGFIADFLDWLFNALPDQDETWIIEYSGGSQIQVKKCGDKFLPDWYIQ